MTLTFSRRLAIAAGLVLPVLETVRRWHQLGDVQVWVVGIKGVMFALTVLALIGALSGSRR